MGQNKLARFAELHTFSHVIEADFDDVYKKDHAVKSNWHSRFGNSNPIVLELGCGKGEYTVNLAKAFPEKNFIGVDIKGNRMWVGAKQAIDDKLGNVNFLRTRIEFIDSFFEQNEVDEIWITFPDPQMQKNRKKKRLTHPVFLSRYRKFLKPDGVIHLKTDNDFLYNFTAEVANLNNLEVKVSTSDLYHSDFVDLTYGVKTYYEQMFLGQGKNINYICFSLQGVEQFIDTNE